MQLLERDRERAEEDEKRSLVCKTNPREERQNYRLLKPGAILSWRHTHTRTEREKNRERETEREK